MNGSLTAGDMVNGLFEAFGAWAVWGNVARLRKDRDVKGIVWQYTAVFMVWGWWNLYYYPSLGQWWSTAAGAVLVIGNTVWVFMWLKIRRSRK